MNYTNIHNLPSPLVSAIRNDTYDKVGDISITGLIEPPRIRQLRIRHDEQITEDAAECLWRLIGSIGHTIIERADTDNHLAEERLTMKRLGWTVSGKSDLLDPNMVLSDYKFTSVYSFLLGDKPEWTAQLNLYAALYREHHFEVKGAQIVAVLRDWSKTRAKREPDYPQVGVIVQPIELWTPEQQEDYLLDRIILHQANEILNDRELDECTDQERWARPDTWAVKKPANKKAFRVFESLSEAESFIDEKHLNAGYIIEHREGSKTVRCEDYCTVSQFCNQFQALPSR